MPQPGCAWWHIVLTGRNTWLPGDRRGFRNKHHRIHSSGDYKHPPPADEHIGLRIHNQRQAGEEKTFPPALQSAMGQAMLATIQRAKWACLALAVSHSHAHILLECDEAYPAAKRAMGRLKQVASFAARDTLPGNLWADGGKPIPIRSYDHQRRVFRYILDHARKEGAWVWRFPREKTT